jgi:hypothetical protein
LQTMERISIVYKSQQRPFLDLPPPFLPPTTALARLRMLVIAEWPWASAEWSEGKGSFDSAFPSLRSGHSGLAQDDICSQGLQQ